jgi:hypothetical protein
MGEKSSEQLTKFGLNAMSIDYKVRQWSDRRKKLSASFNSYVFVQLEERIEFSFQSAGAVRYLFWLKAAIVRDEEINTIKDWLSTRINAMFH